MKSVIFLIVCSLSAILAQLIYSPSYANVYLEPVKQEVVAGEIEDLQRTSGGTNSTEMPTQDENDDGPETATEPESEQVRLTRPERLTEQSAAEKGIYYIYHPNGLLQKVVYATKEDADRMAYFTQVNYENVEPIQEPIFTYDPDTFVLQRIQLQ